MASDSAPRSALEAWLGAAFVTVVSTVYGGSLILARLKYQASTDSHYHFAVAREIVQGKLRGEAEPHLPWTILVQLPVDHYFGFHLLLAPFAALPNAVLGLKLATLAFFVAVPLCLFWFLRARGAHLAWAWSLLALLFSNQDWRYLMLRGGNLILVLSLVFLQAAFFSANVRRRRIGIVGVSYLAALCYQGGIVLLPLHLAALATTFALRRDLLEKRQLWEPLLTVLGLALGFVINPYMNGHAATLKFLWFHISYMDADPAGLYPGLREFGPIPLDYLTANPEFIVAPCVVLFVAGWVVLRARRGRPPSYAVAVSLGAALAGIVLSARAIRMREYAVPWAILFLGVATPPLSLRTSTMRRAASLALGVAVCLFLLIKWPDTYDLLGEHLPTAQYQGARQVLEAHRGPPVLNIAEGDYTTLRWEDPGVATVQGLSHYFLYPNRPVFDDVTIIRDSRDRTARLGALQRFYARGVRLVAVQHRNSVFRLLERYPAAFQLVYRSPYPQVSKYFASSIYVMDGPRIHAAIAQSAEPDGEDEPPPRAAPSQE